MTNPGTILRASQLFAKKELGQNFLADPNAARRIVNLARIKHEDTVLEIGSGLGALTVHAAKQAKKLYAVEKDHRLIEHLKNELSAAGVSNVEVINQDIFKVDIQAMANPCADTNRNIYDNVDVNADVDADKDADKDADVDVDADKDKDVDADKDKDVDKDADKNININTDTYGDRDEDVVGDGDRDEYINANSGSSPRNKLIVIGNLPYNISSQVLFKLIDNRDVISRAALMFQKELAQRICAPPGGRDYGRLSAVMQYCSHVSVLTDVGAKVFFPKPDVESRVIEVNFCKEDLLPPEKELYLFRVIKAAFSKRRKTLKNSLTGADLALSKDIVEKALNLADIDPIRRAETLSVTEFRTLSEAFWQLSTVV